MAVFRFFLIAGFCVLLAACQTMDSAVSSARSGISRLGSLFGDMAKEAAEAVPAVVARNCPRVEILRGHRSLYQFTNPAKPRDKNGISAVSITGLNTDCTIGKKDITVEMTIDFKSVLGPKGRLRAGDRPGFSYPYFVSIMAPDGQPIAQEVFAVSVSYGKTQETLTHQEKLRQVIPLQGMTAESIQVGFVLSEEELAYNRSIAPPLPPPPSPVAKEKKNDGL